MVSLKINLFQKKISYYDKTSTPLVRQKMAKTTSIRVRQINRYMKGSFLELLPHSLELHLTTFLSVSAFECEVLCDTTYFLRRYSRELRKSVIEFFQPYLMKSGFLFRKGLNYSREVDGNIVRPSFGFVCV